MPFLSSNDLGLEPATSRVRVAAQTTRPRKHIWRNYCREIGTEYWKQIVEGPCELISEREVEEAIRNMKVGKAAGPSEIVVEMLKAAGNKGVKIMTKICNHVVREGAMPREWELSTLIPIYKGKGDPMECGSYRAIKLLEHGMKVLERVLERRLRMKST